MTHDVSGFRISIKKYEDDKSYEQYEDRIVSFDPSFLIIDDITNIQRIINEINELSYKLYYYGQLYDEQNRICLLYTSPSPRDS